MAAPIFVRACAGSSPLARGTRMNVKKLLSTRRFIPAYAGNSFGQRSLAITLYGSSPLTRGTLRTQRGSPRLGRFIPAYAGNSLSTNRTASRWAVHPRLRGELIQASTSINRQRGSSPLTRGTHLQTNYDKARLRFIPAYAGNSKFIY